MSLLKSNTKLLFNSLTPRSFASNAMNYSDTLMSYYKNKENVGTLDESDENVGTAIVGAPACGDVLRLQIKVGEDGKIEDAKFKTFGCGSAIASSAYTAEILKDRSVESAKALKNTEIANALNLPPVKVHCSILSEEAVKAAIADWEKKHKK